MCISPWFWSFVSIQTAEMYIEEVEDQIEDRSEERRVVVSKERERRRVVVSDAKRVLVGAGARALFYPTLLYNVLRNKIQAEFRWWDRVDQVVEFVFDFDFDLKVNLVVKCLCAVVGLWICCCLC